MCRCYNGHVSDIVMRGNPVTYMTDNTEDKHKLTVFAHILSHWINAPLTGQTNRTN